MTVTNLHSTIRHPPSALRPHPRPPHQTTEHTRLLRLSLALVLLGPAQSGLVWSGLCWLVFGSGPSAISQHMQTWISLARLARSTQTQLILSLARLSCSSIFLPPDFATVPPTHSTSSYRLLHSPIPSHITTSSTCNSRPPHDLTHPRFRSCPRLGPCPHHQTLVETTCDDRFFSIYRHHREPIYSLTHRPLVPPDDPTIQHSTLHQTLAEHAERHWNIRLEHH